MADRIRTFTQEFEVYRYETLQGRIDHVTEMITSGWSYTNSFADDTHFYGTFGREVTPCKSKQTD